jgi:hypothetical protein
MCLIHETLYSVTDSVNSNVDEDLNKGPIFSNSGIAEI